MTDKDVHDIAAELMHMAKHPTMFTKAEMAELMLTAASKMRKDKEHLAHVRSVLLEAAAAVASLENQLEAAIVVKGQRGF